MENNTRKYEEFRKRYPEFIYHSYEMEEQGDFLQVTYHFEIPGLAEFSPAWTFPRPRAAEGNVPEQGKLKGNTDRLLEKMVFSLGMTELVSYWKITCSPLVKVKAGSLTGEQIQWWKDLYFHGLGEFFYVNGIREAEISGFMEIQAEAAAGESAGEENRAEECLAGKVMMGDGLTGNTLTEECLTGQTSVEKTSPAPSQTPVLVPIGGGKDSAVTLELLKEAGQRVMGYIINPRGATLQTAEKAGLSESQVICVRRTLDKNMLELNKQGFLNGHTPFSAIVAFSSLIAARLYGLSWVALSNESSANESTVAGSMVNHQYSKSFRFEKDFHDYAARYLPGSAYYFSLLRPLSEFQIARYFAGCRQYHPVFRSCNAGSKTDSWCGHCPKCLFVYLILSPFLDPEEVREIFGRDMLEDESLRDTLEKLTGIQEEKPFECVGSRSEINTAIVIAIKNRERKGEKLPLLLEYYKSTGLYERYAAEGDHYSEYFDEENLVPKEWLALVKERCVRKENEREDDAD